MFGMLFMYLTAEKGIIRFMKRYLIYVVAVFTLVCLLSSERAYGENDEFPFSVNIIYPENQIEANSGYFYIDLKADETQELSIEISNSTAQDIVINIESADCYTSPQGGLVFMSGNTSEEIGIIDSSFFMSQRIEPSAKQLALKPNENRTIAIKVQAPSINEGETIGAIRFAAEEDQKNENENSSNLQLNVKRAMTIPVRVRLSEQQSSNIPAISIGELNFDDEKKTMTLSLSNNLPSINRNASISYEVLNSMGTKLFDNSLALDKMAPKTSVKVPIQWLGGAASPGKYIIKISYPISESKTEEVSREIEISKSEANEIETQSPNPNKTDVPKENNGIYYGVVLFLLAVIVLLLVLLLKKRKKL